MTKVNMLLYLRKQDMLLSIWYEKMWPKLGRQEQLLPCWILDHDVFLYIALLLGYVRTEKHREVNWAGKKLQEPPIKMCSFLDIFCDDFESWNLYGWIIKLLIF